MDSRTNTDMLSTNQRWCIFFLIFLGLGGLYLAQEYVEQSYLPLKQLTSLIKSRSSLESSDSIEYSPQASAVYIYSASEISQICSGLNGSHYSMSLGDLHEIDYLTKDPQVAGSFVVLIDGSFVDSCRTFSNLPHWNGGVNHLVLILTADARGLDISSSWRTELGHAVLGQPVYEQSEFRYGRDLLIPALPEAQNFSSMNTYLELPMLVPVRRKHLITFSGAMYDDLQQKTLQFFRSLENKKNVFLDLNCSAGVLKSTFSEWSLCEDIQTRTWSLGNATFSLVPIPESEGQFSSVTFQLRLAESLKYGSVPVCLGGSSHRFPFAEILDWRRAALVVPYNIRPLQLLRLLLSYKENELFELKRQGRILWDSYFKSPKAILETTLLVLRMQSLKRGPPAPSFPVKSFPPTTLKKSAHQRRHILSTNDLHRMGDHFHEFSATPFEPPFSPDIIAADNTGKFDMLNFTAYRKTERSIEQLGGNFPTEQLSVVILNYKRIGPLQTQIERLKNLTFVKNIIGVWNDLETSPKNISWPDSNGKFKLVMAEKNSLNNRFIPYDTIDTEAVLILDDDVMPPVGQITFGFHIWRQSRDRIVGIYNRHVLYHRERKHWTYFAASTCEYSMVLTGTMFVHKYYLNIYTYVMPAPIRDLVDKNMNCEDLAMNFLVAHISRKPPLKTSPGQNGGCKGPGCKGGLSGRGSHYAKRDECVAIFTQIYGYIPLLFTQYRADSVLFTGRRKPKNSQPCGYNDT